MSQYGAQGAALQGLDYKRIVGFYYPGTSWSTFRGKVRVLVTGDTTSDVVVSPATGLTLRDLGSGTTYALPQVKGLTRWRIDVGPGNASVVSYRTDAWHPWKPGGRDALVGDGEFFADGPLTLWTPSGAHRYRGTLRSASPSAGSAARDTVNVVTMDDYVRGVIPREMPASWQPEAVKAQAVAARTYAVWSRAQNPRRYYQICDTTSCQVYGGSDAEDSRSNAAVTATSGQILTYDGKPAFTQFSSSSGGWTSAGSVPYLPAQADPYDGFPGNPVHSWSTTIDTGRIEAAYPSLGAVRRIDVVSRDGNGQWRGRVESLVLRGTKGDRTISGDSFRWMFGLRSSWFGFDRTTILKHWARLGGARSVVGAVRGVETPSGRGSEQVFAKGRIYWSSATGAHELHGPVLAAYRGIRSTRSRLGFPTTDVAPELRGVRVRFQRGNIWWHRGTGAVPVIGKPINARYLQAGGVRSRLGWPVRTNRKTARGERVDFQHGFIVYLADTHRTRLRITG
jgi:SpoIID/LytB domain protein